MSSFSYSRLSKWHDNLTRKNAHLITARLCSLLQFLGLNQWQGCAKGLNLCDGLINKLHTLTWGCLKGDDVKQFVSSAHTVVLQLHKINGAVRIDTGLQYCWN